MAQIAWKHKTEQRRILLKWQMASLQKLLAPAKEKQRERENFLAFPYCCSQFHWCCGNCTFIYFVLLPLQLFLLMRFYLLLASFCSCCCCCLLLHLIVIIGFICLMLQFVGIFCFSFAIVLFCFRSAYISAIRLINFEMFQSIPYTSDPFVLYVVLLMRRRHFC